MTTRTINFLPDVFKTPANQKFLKATLDQLVSEPQFKKLNGYIGRKFSPTFNKADNYLPENSRNRSQYQLEPSVVVTDELKNVKFFASYTDLLNKIYYYGGNISNHSRLFENEAYSYDGLIDFDKLINFNQYYWIPEGPAAIEIYTGAVNLFDNFVVSRNDRLGAYQISGFGSVENPTITLARGGTYTFQLNQPGSNFWIQTEPGLAGKQRFQRNISTRDVLGVDRNGADNGVVTFTVPQADAQDFFKRMPTISLSESDRSFATNLTYDQIDSQLWSNIVAKFGGIDGVTDASLLQNTPRIIFLQNLIEPTTWNDAGVYNRADYGVEKYDEGQDIPQSKQFDIWQINLELTDDGDYIVNVDWNSTFPVSNKIHITTGNENAGRDFYRKDLSTIEVVPALTAEKDLLFFNDGTDQQFYGQIKLVNDTSSIIDVNDIIGKPQYSLKVGEKTLTLSNGMKIKFNATVTPESYINNFYYVEGVGKSIRLVKTDLMQTPELDFKGITTIPFDIYGYSIDNFDQILNGPTNPDYITINRSSVDANAWSRSNRWFHQDIILQSAIFNNVDPDFDHAFRATRPIIEFDPDLQLFNNGRVGVNNIDVVDFSITNALLYIEGTISTYFTDLKFSDGMTVIFANDNDPTVRNRVYKVRIVSVNDEIRVHLVKVGDILPYDVVTPRLGITLPLKPLSSTTPYDVTFNRNNRQIDISAVGAANFNSIADISLDGVMSATIGIVLGHSFWFNGNSWAHSQQKTNINTMPLFDIVDENLVSFSDQTVYVNTEFTGSPIFSYTLGSGVTDSVLGFPIAYRSIANTGDILFTNNVDADSFNYLSGITTTSIKLNTGFVPVIVSRFQLKKKNVWVTEDQSTKQYQLFSNICDGITSYYEIDITPTDLTIMPSVFLYVNGTLIQERDLENNTQYEIVKVGDASSGVPSVLTLYVKYPIVKDDRVDFLIYSTRQSNIGYYEIPENLELNALNESFSHITLGQMRKHVSKIAEKSPELVGVPLASNNLRDLDIKSRGGNILQHSAPMIYSSLFLLNDEVNFVDSIHAAQFEYSKFKYKFLENSGEIAVNHGNVPATVDAIMLKINAVNNIQMPWYYTDMVPYDQNKKVIEYIVLATEILEYEIPTIFDDTKLSNQAILVYVNGVQLIKNHDYEFSKTRPAVVFKHFLEYDDVIAIVLYADTDGCYVPETPTKLGLYPKFTPEIFLDDTYLTPMQVIRGHDGSITPAFGDVRDELLLELEKRIYNNIKAEYDPTVFDINSILPERFRNSGYTKSEFDNIISSSYTQWLGSNRVAITANDWFDENNFFTWNYSSNRITNADPRLNNTILPGYWRGIFLFLYGTDAPHTRPWESLGFSEKPEWWNTYYGVAPYTGGNLVLWRDIEQGLIREGPRAGINKLYARPGVTKIIPVTDSGELRAPLTFLTHVSDTGTAKAPFKMGDIGPIESAWRRSSDYPFAVQQAIALMRPGVYFGSLASTQKYRRHLSTNQFFIQDTKQKITPYDFVFNGENIDGTIMRNAGYTNWIVDYATSRGVNPITLLHKYVDRLSINLGYKVAGFTDKNYLKIYAEQSNPNSVNNSVVIPDENYKVYLYKSSPVSVINYSALVITSTAAGFTVSGYDVNNPIFKIIPSNTASSKHIVKVLELAGTIYEGWEDTVIDIPYGQEFKNTHQVVDFIVSYGRYLTSLGLQFKTFDQSLGEERNWELSVKEFLTWVQQGWGNGSLLVLSPVLNEFTVIHPTAVVDKIENSRLGSKILDVGFNFIPPKQSSIERNDGVFSITTPADRTIGLVSLALVQYEHVLIFDNQTEFKDIIYSPALGNRQYRLKLIGNKTDNWAGQLSLPGFMHTNSDISGWEVFRDYNKGELVQYKGNIYTALAKILASDNFDFSKWKQVDSTFFKSGIIPNLAYGAGRFENMYDIDGQVQDNNLNSLSDGLIGNQSRSYLIDLGISPTSQSKFYQGFIKEKGTHAAISALGDLSINHITGKIAVTEEWAFRVGEYGALESNQFLEVQLGEALFKQDPVTFNLQNPGDELQSENSVTMYYNTLYKKPLTFRPNFLNDRDDSVNSENDFPTAGYVHLDDIDATIFDLSNPVFIGDLASKVYSGFKIWVAKNLDGDWDVLRVSESQRHITNADYNLDGIAEFTTDLPHELSDGEVFAIKNFSTDVDNFYRVYRITSMHTVYATISSSLEATMISTPNMEGYGTLFKLSSMRIDKLNEVANLTPKFGWKDGDKVWADKNSSDRWAVYNKTSPWKYSSDLNELGVDNKPVPLSLNEQYGSTIASNDDGSIVIVGSPGQTGRLPRPFIKNYLGLYEISPGTTDTTAYNSTHRFGKSIAVTGNSVAMSSHSLTGVNNSVLTYLLDIEGTGVQQNTIVDPQTNVISGFGDSVHISNDSQWMFVSSPKSGKIYCYNKNVVNQFTLFYTITGDTVDGEFGKSVVSSDNGDILYVGAPQSMYNVTTPSGAVYVYKRVGLEYNIKTIIIPSDRQADSKFGSTLCLTVDELLIGVPGWSNTSDRYYFGAVYRYLTSDLLSPIQIIKKPYSFGIENFGTNIVVNQETKQVAVSSSGAFNIAKALQDRSFFMLDSGTTTVSDYEKNAGAVYLYDLISDSILPVYAFSQELSGSGIRKLDNFGMAIASGGNLIFVGSPNYDSHYDPNNESSTLFTNEGKVAIFENKYLAQSWQLIRKQEPKVDYKSVTRNYIYDKKQQNILAHLDIYDPAKGKILGIAEDDIEFKTSFDPAAYNNTNPTTEIYCWGSQQVGKVWWDTDTVRYIDYEQGSLDYRTRNWGKMFPGSTVDVYEWVSSKVKPSEYSGDGVPKYTDDSKYVVQMNVHQATGLITTSYYFWVKNKETFDSLLPFRNSSILEISKFITYPTQQDIPYAAYIKNNAVALFNSAKYISADSTIFHAGYDLLNTDTLIHNEFKLVNESAMTTDLPKNIVDKMIDSLSGEDQAGNVVPDYRLAEAERYGISIRPRQTMLVNKLQGVKNIVQYVNTVLKDVPASEEFDLTQLTAADKIPFTWDELGNSMLVNSYEELSYLDISALRKPVYAPAALNDPDNMAMLKLSSGQSILVMADNNFDNEWTIYEIDYEKNDLGVLDQTTPVFKLARMQSYRTADYWNYTDWYLPVYDFTAKPTYTVDTIKDMAKLTLAPNDTIHVRDSGGGKFKIFAVNNDLSTTVVGIQNGTIQLSDALWSHNTNKIGFDNDNFDSVKFDLNPSVELRNILYALRDSIFVNTLSTEFTKMFFMMLQYILSEQRLVDWVFKSSFISVLHNLRQLAQYPSYVRDNQTYLSDYINEIKPYRTKIREFVTQYDGNDIGNIISTDFDLPSYYDADLKTWRSPNNEHARDAGIIASRDEYLAWRTNNTYHIQSVTVETPGIGYIVPPTLTVTGGGLPDGDTRHAKLTAVVSFATGTVLRVNVDSHGSGYTSRPTIVVTGGGIDNSNIEGGVATCYAVMGNSNVRTFDTVIKFDRVSYSTDITPWQANTDYNTNNYVTFQHVVYQAIDSINSGDFFNITQFTKVADHGLSTAVDRSSAYYQPTPGMTPNIPERLFAGVDYPGNTIDGNRLDEEDYDTIIESYFTDLELGTDTDYSSIVDSGKFISAYTSHAPEEMLPGMMYDTLYITVINKDTGTLPPVGFRISSGMIQDYFTSFDIDSTTMFDGSSENFDTALTTFNELHTEFDDGLATFDRKPINWDITRVSESNTTVLTEPLVWPPVDANPVIHVADVSALPIPSLLLRKPGVIYINGERITYYTIDSVTNTLGQLRRGVAGTGIGAEYPVGAKVSDISVEQQLPAGSATKAWYPALSGVGITGYTNDGTGLMRQTSPQTAFLQQSPAGPVSISV